MRQLSQLKHRVSALPDYSSVFLPKQDLFLPYIPAALPNNESAAMVPNESSTVACMDCSRYQLHQRRKKTGRVDSKPPATAFAKGSNGSLHIRSSTLYGQKAVPSQTWKKLKDEVKGVWTMAMIVMYLSALLWLVASLQAEAIEKEGETGLTMVGVAASEAMENLENMEDLVSVPAVAEETSNEELSAALDEACEEKDDEEDEAEKEEAMPELPDSSAQGNTDEWLKVEEDDEWLKDGFEEEEEEEDWTLLEEGDA